MVEGVEIRFKDVIEKANVTGDARFALKYALDMLSTVLKISVPESTIRYAEDRALKYVENKIDKHAITASLLEFLEVVLGDAFSPCTPPEWVEVGRKYGLYCLAIDQALNIIYAYDPNEDALKVKNV